MSKRFTDTAIWDKPWFRRLKPEQKCAFSFIKDRCDNAGVWAPDFEAAEFFVGMSVDWDDLLQNCNDNIVVMENGKWWLRDFATFQYGQLSETTKNKAHVSHIALLRSHGLWPMHGPSMGHGAGTNGHKEKEKEKVKAKVKEKEEEKEKPPKRKYAEHVTLTEVEYGKLVTKYGKGQTQRLIDTLDAYKLSKGKRYASDYGAIRTWVIDKVQPVAVKERQGATTAACHGCGKLVLPTSLVEWEGRMLCVECARKERDGR